MLISLMCNYYSSNYNVTGVPFLHILPFFGVYFIQHVVKVVVVDG